MSRCSARAAGLPDKIRALLDKRVEFREIVAGPDRGEHIPEEVGP